ncbi:MAG: chemotaxis protein CheR, partial [Planctomycetota bacterium]
DGKRKYQVKENIREMITFGRLNLSVHPYPLRGPLDVVFCRNVMIYFDNQVRKRVLENIYSLLKEGGYLIVGHAESLTGLLSDFKRIEPSVYMKG